MHLENTGRFSDISITPKLRFRNLSQREILKREKWRAKDIPLGGELLQMGMHKCTRLSVKWEYLVYKVYSMNITSYLWQTSSQEIRKNQPQMRNTCVILRGEYLALFLLMPIEALLGRTDHFSLVLNLLKEKTSAQ